MEKVVLGMPGVWAEDVYEVANHYKSKIGGVPDWPIPDIEISPDLLECQGCKSKLYLVAQIHAPISTERLKIEERIFYIFGCIKPSCGNIPQSWRVIRVQKHSVSDSDEKSKECSFSFDFNECDDGSDDDINLEDLGHALSGAATLASNSKKLHEAEARLDTKPFPSQTRTIDNCLAVMPCFYIYICKKKQ